MPKHACPNCLQSATRRNGSKNYYKCFQCGTSLKLNGGKLQPVRRAGVQRQRQGPVEQVRPAMAWWEYEAMQEARE